MREADEWAQGHVPGAVFIPRGFLELRIEDKVPDKAPEVVVYCAGGTRSALAAQTLQELGYTNVASMAGGFGKWKEAGFPIEMPRSLTAEQKQRYSRHLLVPEVGEAGQTKLLDSKVLLVGAGGLGSPAGLYLAAAGVGTIGLVDFDVVDLSNLQRQVLHTTARVGTPKTESAEKTIRALNPDVKVVRHDLRLEAGNVMDVFAPYDVILDGCDNFSTKYLVNDAAVLMGKPLVYGSIFRFDGQATTFVPKQGPATAASTPSPRPRAGAVVRRSRRARRAARRRGPDPGHRGHQGAPGEGRSAGGAAAHLRRARHDVPRVQGAARSEVRGLRRAPDDQEPADLEWSCHFDRRAPVGA